MEEHHHRIKQKYFLKNNDDNDNVNNETDSIVIEGNDNDKCEVSKKYNENINKKLDNQDIFEKEKFKNMS